MGMRRDNQIYHDALQHARAETLVHKGQCEGCRAWREDGQPPTVHRHLCPFGPDGSQLGPVR